MKSFLANRKIYVRNIFIFLIFFIIYFIFQYKTYFDSNLWLILMNLAVLVIFLASAFKAIFGFYIFIFFIPLLNNLTTIFKTKPVPILLLLFSGFFLGFLLNYFGRDYKRRLEFKNPHFFFDRDIYIPAMLFLLLIFISAFVSSMRYANFYPFITNNFHNLMVNIKSMKSDSAIYTTLVTALEYISAFLLVFAIFNIIRNIRELVVSIFVVIFSTILSSFMVLFQFFVNPYVGSFSYWVKTGRLNATFTDPNSLGAYCLMIFPVFFAAIFFVKKWYLKIVLSVFFAIFIFMTFLSGSRSALTGIVPALLVFAGIGISNLIKILKKRKPAFRRKVLISILSVFAVCIILISVIFATDNIIKADFFRIGIIQRTSESINTFISYFKTSGFSESLKAISNYRYIFWQQAFNMAKEHTISGVGTGAYLIEVPDYLYRFEPGFVQVDYAGNFYLEILAELGITGFAVLAFFFYRVYRKVFRNYRNQSFKDFKNDKLATVRNQLGRVRLLFTGLVISFSAMLAGLVFGSHVNFTEIKLSFFAIIGLILAYIKLEDRIYTSIKSPAYISSINSAGFKRYERFLSIPQKTGLLIILLVFSLSFLLSSLTSLSIAGKQNSCYWFNEYGFYNYENIEGKKARWIAMDASTIIPEKKGNYLIIPMQDYTPEKISSRNTVTIFIDNLAVKKVKLEDSNKWYNIKVPIPAFTQQRLTLTIVSSRSWTPAGVGLNPDTRELAAIVGEFSFK